MTYTQLLELNSQPPLPPVAQSRQTTRRLRRKAQKVATTPSVGEMSIGAFARAGLVLRVRSKVLGREVVFASDNATVDPGETAPVFRAAELLRLLVEGHGAEPSSPDVLAEPAGGESQPGGSE